MMGITYVTAVVLALILVGGVALSVSLAKQYSAQAATVSTQDGEQPGEPGGLIDVSTPGETGSSNQDPDPS